MILGALEDAGGREYLADQARKIPSSFLTLVGKVLPADAKAAAAAGPEAPMIVVEIDPDPETASEAG
jgi:hypothetical protein